MASRRPPTASSATAAPSVSDWAWGSTSSACGSMPPAARGWRAPPVRPATPPSRGGWGRARPCGWPSTATTRPRPSCSPPCAAAVRGGSAPCRRGASGGGGAWSDRCWTVPGPSWPRPRAASASPGWRIPPTPRPTRIATTCAMPCCRTSASAGPMPPRRWRAARRSPPRRTGCWRSSPSSIWRASAVIRRACPWPGWRGSLPPGGGCWCATPARPWACRPRRRGAWRACWRSRRRVPMPSRGWPGPGPRGGAGGGTST